MITQEQIKKLNELKQQIRNEPDRSKRWKLLTTEYRELQKEILFQSSNLTDK